MWVFLSLVSEFISECVCISVVAIGVIGFPSLWGLQVLVYLLG